MENQDRNEVLQIFVQKNSKFMDEIVNNQFKNWIEQYMGDDIPENEKILNYNIGTVGYGTTNDNSGIIKATIDFTAETKSENSIWKNYIQGQSTYYDRNTCYIEIEVLDEKNYKINYIGSEPKNLAEFKRQFEEYKQTHKKVVVVPAEENVRLNSENILKVSNGITIIAGILIVLSVGFIIAKGMKLKR